MSVDLTVDSDVNPTADFSIEEDDNEPNGRQTIGTPMDLVTSAQAGNSGKALNGLDFPITYDHHSLPSYSTDAHAWDMTSGRQFCRRQEGYPFATMKFGLASTAGTFSRLHMDPNGQGTYINVNVGTKIWHTLTPKPQKSFAEAFGSIDPFKDFDVEMPNTWYWDIETVVLQDGMRLYVTLFLKFIIFYRSQDVRQNHATKHSSFRGHSNSFNLPRWILLWLNCHERHMFRHLPHFCSRVCDHKL
jgi:hypothetical protein